MKVYLYIMLILLISSLIAFGQETKINPHNFSTNNWAYSERCNPCHVDNPETKAGKVFLISYASDSLSATDSLYLSGVSKLCFACHDGTIAGYGVSADFGQGLAVDGTTHNHPVSVIYHADSLQRNRLFNPDITMSGLGGTIAEDLLVNGRVECTSCHDPHFSMHKTACKSCPPGRTYSISSLWLEIKKSALCLICHDL